MEELVEEAVLEVEAVGFGGVVGEVISCFEGAVSRHDLGKWGKMIEE